MTFVSEVFYFLIKKKELMFLQIVVRVHLCHAGGALLFTIEKRKLSTIGKVKTKKWICTIEKLKLKHYK